MYHFLAQYNHNWIRGIISHHMNTFSALDNAVFVLDSNVRFTHIFNSLWLLDIKFRAADTVRYQELSVRWKVCTFHHGYTGKVIIWVCMGHLRVLTAVGVADAIRYGFKTIIHEQCTVTFRRQGYPVLNLHEKYRAYTAVQAYTRNV